MKRMAFGLLAIVAGLSGCQTAHQVQKGPDSGVVAIPENSDVWPTYYRRAAIAMMEKHVGQYVIDDEREVKTGTSTTGNQQVNGGPNGQSITSASSTQATTEYRITYHKKTFPVGNPITGVGSNGLPAGSGLGMGNRPVGGLGQPAGTGGVMPTGGIGGGTIPSVQPYGATGGSTGFGTTTGGLPYSGSGATSSPYAGYPAPRTP